MVTSNEVTKKLYINKIIIIFTLLLNFLFILILININHIFFEDLTIVQLKYEKILENLLAISNVIFAFPLIN